MEDLESSKEEAAPGAPNKESISTATESTPPQDQVNEPPTPELQVAKKAGEKVKVHFVAVGSAPLMKKNKFQIGADQRFSAVTAFLRKMLKLTGSGSSLFLYCSSAFVPSPDQLLSELNEFFSVRGELVIHYSLQEAWG